MPTATKAKTTPFVAVDAFVNAYAINNRITRFLIESLAEEAWRAEPPGGKGRTIAAIVSHLHNVRVMWLKVAAKGTRIPEQLERATVTPREALKALDASHDAMSALLRSALGSDGRIKGFKPDVAAFFGYLVSHDAHHRGQIAMLARQTGHALPKSVDFGMWEWGKR
ncbi:MAG: DinB family protein [Planctomycetes bacterium]|nr:DinB family protein [Planctomycetota bacterium]MBI3846246.1 DinB family protein [Planctomycetota bacterium]